MTLFTTAQTEQLIANCQEQIVNNDAGRSDIDFKPVVKLFTPDAQCYAWLLTELDTDGLALGLRDLGLERPELGYVNLTELRTVRGKLGLPIERGLHFDADKPISAHVDEARTHGRVVT